MPEFTLLSFAFCVTDEESESLLSCGGCFRMISRMARIGRLAEKIGRGGAWTRGLYGTVPRSGVMDGIRNVYDNVSQGNQEQSEQKVFDAQMKYMSQTRKFNGDRFLEYLGDVKSASGLGGLREHLPWVSNNPALGELKEQENIVNAFSDQERRDVFAIGIGGIKRVARDVGVGREAVDAVVMQIKTLVGVQKWVRRRIESGERLPKEANEFREMLSLGRGVNKGRRAKNASWNPGIKGGTTARRKFK